MVGSNNLIILSSITAIHACSQGSPLLAIHKSSEKPEISTMLPTRNTTKAAGGCGLMDGY